MFQATLLMLMLTVPLLAWTAPEMAIMSVHPASIALIAVYVGGVYATNRVREEPMWEPVNTSETEPDEPDDTAPATGDAAPDSSAPQPSQNSSPSATEAWQSGHTWPTALTAWSSDGPGWRRPPAGPARRARG